MEMKKDDDDKASVAAKPRAMSPMMYDLGLWIFNLCLGIFFRQLDSRSAWRIPARGPVLVVAGPHSNQFVDSVVLMRVLQESQAQRRVSFLTAEKSMREPYIGAMTRAMGSLPVVRGMDRARAGQGTISLPDPEDPTLVRGNLTDFTQGDFMPGGSITLPRVGEVASATQAIASIISPTELRLKSPFPPSAAEQISPTQDGKIRESKFKVAPHIDQSQMFEAVFQELLSGGCVGIFPEGGSHDRPDLLPLKPGAAIIALGLLAKDPDCGLSIIPCGINYFHAHKFRSRAVVEFGPPVQVHADQIAAYRKGGKEKRDAVGSLLETIRDGLASVTQLSPDYETLQLIQASRRLYMSPNKKRPLAHVIEFNRRLLQGYSRYQDDERVVRVKKEVLDYNRRLRALGIKDHQVEWGDVKQRPWWLILLILLSRTSGLVLLAIGTLPGLLLFWPVFVTAKIISVQKQRKALAASEVKVRARDIVSTWKVLVAMGLAPSSYVWYTAVATLWLHHARHGGSLARSLPRCMDASTYVPDRVPLSLFTICFFALMIAVTFAALRTGEVGMDIIKSLRPLLVALDPRSASSLVQLREYRQALAANVTDLINTLGPDVFPDFQPARQLLDDDPSSDFRDPFQSRLKSMPSSPGIAALSQTSSVRPLGSLEDRGSLSAVNRKVRDVVQK
ncbi:acyltransferase [Phlyctema vagabunda]|uniref:Acyltransferase n=1 Tax=Phlyctema vagabunda TaxID=108571 RepID=A0ABR4PG61_9HELO